MSKKPEQRERRGVEVKAVEQDHPTFGKKCRDRPF
jgi:hypothetical protein